MDSTSTSSTESFDLKGSTDAFQARKEAVFGSLLQVELTSSVPVNNAANFKAPKGKREKRRHDDDDQGIDVSQFKRSESIFKRPTPDKPPPRKSHCANNRFNNRRNVPDYQKNPGKWTKYSLDDVSACDMSDRTNTTTALSFLKELEERKRPKEGEDNNAHDDSTKVIFKKRMARGSEHIPNADDKGFVDGKLTMPTYEMGSNKRTPRKLKPDNLSDKIGKSPRLKLYHLEEDNDE